MQPTVKRLLVGGLYAAALCASFLPWTTPSASQVRSAPVPTGNTPVAAATSPTIATSNGTFTDREGGKHNWLITRTHALMWDGAPYLPVGGTFAPRSFTGEGDAAWPEDEKALATLKAKGLRDIIITPGQSLPDVPLPAMQRLLDYLETNGFRYGLGFGTGVNAPLTGLVVKPASYRYYEKESLTATWQTPHADAGLVVLVETGSGRNEIANMGVIHPQGDILTASLETPGNVGRVVALMYPHKALPPGSEGAIPDVWSTYDTYRDRLLTYLEKVKFGKGFHFFLDPLARHLSLEDETEHLIPDSHAFQLEWESYVNRRYSSLEEAYKAWDLAEQTYKSTRDLSRLIPLWANGSGVPYFYDPQTGKSVRVMDVNRSQWWTDFLACRNESLLYYMNALANVLKQSIANVPVVYTAAQSNPIFWNNTHGGYDGLGIASSLRGQSLISQGIAPTYSEAEQAEHTMWCVATEIGPDNVGAPAGTKPLPPISSRVNLGETMESYRGTGVKGFFVNSFQSEKGAHGQTDWLNTPDALDWLKEYDTRLEGNAPSTAAFAPPVLFYPQNDPGPGQLGMIPGTNVLWLNSFQQGQSLDWWPAYRGYTLARSDNQPPDTVLVSLQGKRETHLQVPDARMVAAFTPNGVPVPVKIVAKNMVLVTLDSTPTIFRTNGQTLLAPKEAAEDVLAQLDGLISYATANHHPNAESSKGPLSDAEMDYRKGDYDASLTRARVELFKLVDDVTPFIWMEGEGAQPGTHTFDDKPYSGNSSNGYYLRLSNTNPPSKYGYGVHFPFHVYQEGRYNIWAAVSAPGPEVSPFQWALSDNLPRDPASPTPRGPLYGDGHFGWVLLGSVSLPSGNNTLALYVTNRAVATKKYTFDVDAIFISPRNQPPDGTVKPMPVDPASLQRKKPKVGKTAH